MEELILKTMLVLSSKLSQFVIRAEWKCSSYSIFLWWGYPGKHCSAENKTHHKPNLSTKGSVPKKSSESWTFESFSSHRHGNGNKLTSWKNLSFSLYVFLLSNVFFSQHLENILVKISGFKVLQKTRQMHSPTFCQWKKKERKNLAHILALLAEMIVRKQDYRIKSSFKF